MNNCPLVWIVIGVSGSGKTAVGRLFAEELECDFLEGDRRHPLSNIRKMISRESLEDRDSQMAAFEPITSEENAITVNGNAPIDTVVSALIAKVIRRFPSMEKSWWEREWNFNSL
jgi:gluconokinase